jgi:ribosomal protein S11
MKSLTSLQNSVEKQMNSSDLEFEKLFQLMLKIIPHNKKVETLSKNYKIKRKINYKINYTNNIKQKIRKIPNIAKNSYANRYLIKKKRRLYSKTIITPKEESLTTTEEFELLTKKEKAILREQRRHSFREKFQNFSRNKLLSNKIYNARAAKVFITYVRKNTFVVIFTIIGNNYLFDTKVSAKYSCGSIGFRNKKKTTDFASEQTIKAAGNYLNYNGYTSIDIIYTSNIPFPNRKILNSLIPNPLYVRSLSFNRNRPQSYVRKKKAQRK